MNYLHEDLGGDTNHPLPLMIEKALGKTSVTSVVADTAERAPKGSYKRNYASGFDGWIDEITLRKGSKPDEKAIEKIKSLVDVWRGPKFNGEDWEQGNTPEGFNIRYAGSVSLFKGGSKLGLMSIWFKKNETLGMRIQVLKNPDRGNQIIEIGKIKFEHQRPIKIDREEKNNSWQCWTK